MCSAVLTCPGPSSAFWMAACLGFRVGVALVVTGALDEMGAAVEPGAADETGALEVTGAAVVVGALVVAGDLICKAQAGLRDSPCQVGEDTERPRLLG